MNIHEYQAKALLAKFAVPLLKGGVAYTKDEAMDVARKLGTPVVVVKAQIHAGGRGKGGGVKVAKGGAAADVRGFEPGPPSRGHLRDHEAARDRAHANCDR